VPGWHKKIFFDSLTKPFRLELKLLALNL